MKILIKACMYGILLLAIFEGCRSREFIGPQYITTPADFFVLNNTFEASTDVNNFEITPVSFTADLSATVNWSISIRGLESGAVRKISGQSGKVDVTNALWTGNHDQQNFFRRNENAVAELTFLGSSLVLRDTILISRVKKYNGQGLVLGDDVSVGSLEGFEGTYNFNSPTWSYGPYFDGGEKIASGLDSLTTQFQGKRAFTLHGKDNNNNYFVGGVKRVLAMSEYNTISSNPDSIYVNIYLYGRGDANSRLNYSFEEDDGGIAGHQDNSDDTYEYQFSLGHTGWKLFSIKYSQLQRATNPSFGGSGNGKKEPNKIRNVGFNMISSPAGNEVQVTFDFPIITYGKPFNPNE